MLIWLNPSPALLPVRNKGIKKKKLKANYVFSMRYINVLFIIALYGLKESHPHDMNVCAIRSIRPQRIKNITTG